MDAEEENGGLRLSISRHTDEYLILRMNDKREIKQVINFDKELTDLFNYERNKQLNQFSLLLYKKLKQNTIINEY